MIKSGGDITDRIIFTPDPDKALREELLPVGTEDVFVIADRHTEECALPELGVLKDCRRAVIEAGENHKTLESAQRVWEQMMKSGLRRNSVVVNVGGGVVTDLGGFCASTFKRGVPFINIPTTVLGAVDAAYGGKTGVDFLGTKNMIGTFAMPKAVIVSDVFYKTLPREMILSGYGEILKHKLLSGNLSDLGDPMDGDWLDVVRQSTEVKRKIVAQDPYEKGLRRILNLGHTCGHAYESLAMSKGEEMPHGYAVAYGVVTALVLSRMLAGLDAETLYAVSGHVKSLYPALRVECEDKDYLLARIGEDKKNTSSGEAMMTLLRAPGDAVAGWPVSYSDLSVAIDITRDLLA